MDIVPHAGAVRSVVVIAPDVEPVASAYRNLGYERDEIVGNALRILADQAAFMRTDRIEVTQDRDRPALIADILIAQHLLDHQFGATVGIDRPERVLFGVG